MLINFFNTFNEKWIEKWLESDWSDWEKEMVITVISEYWLKKIFLFFIKAESYEHVTQK
jgi:hypothetical protein